MSEVIAEIVEREDLLEIINVTKAMSEGDFYRQINRKLQGELGELARYIDQTRKNLQKLHPAVSESSEKMPDTSTQLSLITKAAEEATHKVISIAEKVLEDQRLLYDKINDLRNIVSAGKIEEKAVLKIAKDLEEVVNLNKNDLVDVLVALSFQDLTGQKVKKIGALVEEVETRILELLIAFGIKKGKRLKREEMMTQLKKDAEKGIGVNQGLVDDVLRNFGL